uniref:Uncharacterized protein n=1 Tax=Trichuris muris TaxID=70415 RepID=A0A5S6QS57_TRIMR
MTTTEEKKELTWLCDSLSGYAASIYWLLPEEERKIYSKSAAGLLAKLRLPEAVSLRTAPLQAGTQRESEELQTLDGRCPSRQNMHTLSSQWGQDQPSIPHGRDSYHGGDGQNGRANVNVSISWNALRKQEFDSGDYNKSAQIAAIRGQQITRRIEMLQTNWRGS